MRQSTTIVIALLLATNTLPACSSDDVIAEAAPHDHDDGNDHDGSDAGATDHDHDHDHAPPTPLPEAAAPPADAGAFPFPPLFPVPKIPTENPLTEAKA